jgi:hypothetical protein
MDPNEELLGADLMEHRINHNSVRFLKIVETFHMKF